jgi:putative Holliday junction resolvase
MNSRILAVDYGERNFGLAISDPERRLSLPLPAFKARSHKEFIHHVSELISSENVGLIVVGIPSTLKGGESKKTKEVMVFLEKLKERLPVPVECYDERLTTHAALKKMRQADMKLKKHKDKVDSLAAAEILQSYLDSRS